MLTRNLKYNSDASINMEVEHPKYGWITVRASENSCEEYVKELYTAAVTGTLGAIAAADPKSAEQLAAEAQASIDAAALAEAKTDAALRYLVTHTPTEITTYVRNQVNADAVTSLATAQTSIKAIETLLTKLAVAVAEAVKRQLR